MTKNILAGLFLGVLTLSPCSVQADASASVINSMPRGYGAFQSYGSQDCWQYDSTWGSDTGQQCLVTVKITIDTFTADGGRPGAFFVGARAGNQTFAAYSPDGWQPFHGGTPQPAAYAASIPSSLTIVVLDNQNICAISGNQPVEVWAGYGILTPEKEDTVQYYHSVKNPSIPPDHLRNVYVQNDMRKNNKYWKVLDVPCLPPPSNFN